MLFLFFSHEIITQTHKIEGLKNKEKATKRYTLKRAKQQWKTQHVQKLAPSLRLIGCSFVFKKVFAVAKAAN